MEYFIQTVYAGQILLVLWLYLGLNTLSTLIFLPEQRKWSVPAVSIFLFYFFFEKSAQTKHSWYSPPLFSSPSSPSPFLQLFGWLESEALLCACLMSCIVIGAKRRVRGYIGPCVCWSLCIKPCVSARKSVCETTQMYQDICVLNQGCVENEYALAICVLRGEWFVCVCLYESLLYICVCVCWAWARVSVTVQYLSHSC